MSNEDAKLFVAGLPDSMSEDSLRELFESTGSTVVNVSLPKDRMTGRPRGFGFVTLGTPEEAASARSTLDGSMQGGRSISVRPFQAEPPRRGDGGPPSARGGFGGGAGGGGGPPGQDRTLYVGNLPYDASQQEVEELIASVCDAQVVRVHFPMDGEGRKRGFGFVTLASAESAKAAADALQNSALRGRRLAVNVAHPRGERPPRSEGGGPPSSRSFGGGGGGGGGGDFGGPPSSHGGGPQSFRKTFDTRRRGAGRGGGPEDEFPRKRGGGGGGGGAGGGGRGGRGGRGGKNQDNWRNYDDDSDD